jgi:ferredoxin
MSTPTERTVTKKAYLFFPVSRTEKPIIYHLIKDYDLVVNIFRAKVTPREEGYLSLDITGTPENIERAFDYLRTFDVTIHAGNKGVYWDEDRCTHCGNCVAHCPTGALAFIDAESRQVTFCEDLCVECLACIDNCPFDVCRTRF